MLTDAQWTLLEPLVEVCRPHAKVPPRHLRRTIGAVLWRHDNGAKWRRCLPSTGPGGWQPRPSSAGPTWVCGSACSPWSRREACSSA